MSSQRPGSRPPPRALLRWVLRLALVLALVVGGYGALVLVRHDQRVSLPAPTGSYRVGRALYTWTETVRPDPLNSHRAGPRRVSVWLWFPAASPGPDAGSAPYLPGPWSELHLPAPVGWGETALDKVDAHTVANARVAAGRFPVVVLLPGLGFAAPQYSALAVELASHGYLVAGVTPTDSANLTVLDGHPVGASQAGNPSDFSGEHTRASTATALRLMRVWADDARFAARRVRVLASHGRFAGHIDAAHVAYVGHSFGGTSALEACRRDPRCTAAGDLDGGQFGPVVTHGLPVPLLLMGHQNSCITALCAPASASDRADLATARALVSHSRGHAWSIDIDGTEHFDFTDYAAYYLALPLRTLLPLGRLDGDRALRATGDYLTAFLDASVDRTSSTRLPPHRRYVEAYVRAW